MTFAYTLSVCDKDEHPEGSADTRDGQHVHEIVIPAGKARNVVDHQLQKKVTLREFAAGKIAIAQLCDADRMLKAAATHHGAPTDKDCPICTQPGVILCRWLYGEHLGGIHGSARTEEEIISIARAHMEFTVHVVEVCVKCDWNYLVYSYVAGRLR